MTLWTPANLVTAPRYVFDPATFTYTGSNFTSGTNSGSVGGAWTIHAGTPAKGVGLSGFDTIGFAGAQSLINSTAAWPAGSNFFVFHVSKVGTTNGGGLVSHSWGITESRTATQGMVYYPRIGTAFGGSANEGGIFQGLTTAIITRGDIYTDTSFHIVATKTGTSVDLRKDGLSISPTFSTTGAISLSTTNNLRVGSTDPAGEFLTGDVAYLAVLVNPTIDEIQRLEGWAAWKYGLYSQLYAGHPYKAAAPEVPAVTWTPANLVTAPRYIFDPSTFAYLGNNFSSGSNTGSAGGAWTIDAGTPARGTALNGYDAISFTGAQGFVNTAAVWPSGNAVVFTIAKIGTTHVGGLASHSWGFTDQRDATHGWVYYPRGGSGNGGSVNEGWHFQGIGSPLMTRGDIFTDASYHIAVTKIGTNVVFRKDGADPARTVTSGVISTSLSNNFRIGATNPTAEFLTGDVAYVAVLVDPTLDEIQRLEGWAAWKYNLVAQLDGAHPYKAAAPDVGGSPGGPTFTIATCSLRTAAGVWTFSNILGAGGTLVLLNGVATNAKNKFAIKLQISTTGQMFALDSSAVWRRWDGATLGWTLNSPQVVPPNSGLWAQIQDDNGLLATRPFDPAYNDRHPNNGVYPFGLPIGFSWYYGGPTYLGDTSHNLPAGWTAYTVWYVVYCEAFTAGGAAKPSVPCNVITRNCKAWAHYTTGGWTQIQGFPGMGMLSGRSDGAQTGNAGSSLNPVANPDGTFTEQAPPNDIGSGTGWCNHGFPNSRGLFAANSIDGAYGTFEMRVDQPNANKLCTSGSDWWLDANAPFPQNTGYTQSCWIRLTTNFRLFTATNLSTSIMLADPPPPLIGLIP